MVSKNEGGFGLIFIILILSIMIAFSWDKLDFIKNISHSILDPTLGQILNWNLLWGMTILVFFINFIMTLAQKYGTDQKAIKEMKDEQKKIQEEIKKYRENKTKVMELEKKMIESMPKMMKLSMRSVIYTTIPLILLFRWFFDFFSNLEGFKFFGFLSWFWFYIISSIIFSSILRKIMKVV
ncbi:MAG: EMC3/TMCO1 family protein [Candidatus Pacearchaeota archaeon]